MTNKPRNPFPGGLLVVGSDGQIIEAPAFFYEVLEFSTRRSRSIYHLFDPDDPPYMSFSRLVRRDNGVIEYHVAINGSLSGNKGFRYWSLPAVDDSSGPRLCTFYITDESTVIQGFEWERRRIRREILRDVQSTVSEFLSQKLSGIRALAEVLRDVPEAAQQTGARLVAGLDQLRSDVAEMAQTSMVNVFGTDADQPLRVVELADVLSTWGRGHVPVQCRVKQAHEESFIAASLLEGVLLPVVNNAIEATFSNDPVVIFVEQSGDDYVEFRVIDSGVGMADDAKSKGVNPFYTTKSGHLGLGLTNAGEVLERVGGQWTFENSTDSGTTVTLRLPLTSGDTFLGAGQSNVGQATAG